MSLKRPLEKSNYVGETSSETAVKRVRTTSTSGDDKDDSNNDNKDVNTSKDDSGESIVDIKKTNKEDKKEKIISATTSIVTSTTTTTTATKPFGGIFASTSTSSFGSSFGSGVKNSLGFGAVSASSANSIFGKIDKTGFGTSSSSSTDTATGAFGKISSKSNSFPAFGSKSQSDKKNSIFSEEVVPVFGSEKSEARALSPGLTENNVKINGEEDEETVLATRAKLFEMQANELPKKKLANGNAENGGASKEKEIKQQNINDNSNNNEEKGDNKKAENGEGGKDKEDSKKKKATESSVAYEWKTRGVGEIRLKEEKHVSDKYDGKIRNQRLVMRREYGAGSVGGEVILNAQLNSDVKLVRENDSHLRLTSFGIGGKVVTHLIRIKRFKDLKELERKVKNHIDLCRKHKE